MERAYRLDRPDLDYHGRLCVLEYGRDLKKQKQLRAGVLMLVLESFVSAGVAGFFGAMIDKYAPVQGGQNVQLINGKAK